METTFSFPPTWKLLYHGTARLEEGPPELAAEKDLFVSPLPSPHGPAWEGECNQIPSGFRKITLLKPFPEYGATGKVRTTQIHQCLHHIQG